MNTHFPPVEIKITVMGEERKKLTDSDQFYEENIFNIDHPAVIEFKKKLLEEFKGNVDTVILQAKMVVK